MPTAPSLRPAHVALASILALTSCGGTRPHASPVPTAAPAALASGVSPSASQETLAADSPRATPLGTTFTAPKDWTLTTSEGRVTLTAPEGDMHIYLVELAVLTPDEAAARAWKAVHADFARALHTAAVRPGRNGWDDQKRFEYETSPEEKRVVVARALRHGGSWTVVAIESSTPTYDKRRSPRLLVLESLRPKGYVKESFTGKTPNVLDAARLKELSDFVDQMRDIAGIPGIAVSLVQGGKVVFEGGFGARELGKPAKVDAQTLFPIASNTKALTTLLLAEEVDEGKFTWDTPVTAVYPEFKLGDADTTSKVLMKHLVCACTGLPRQDYEWIFEFKNATPKSEMALLGTFQPTTKFGETYQYSNLMAAAAGFVGAKVANPKMELGPGYDAAMKAKVFAPLGMDSTTFDFAKARAANHAGPHGIDFDGKPARGPMDINYSVVPLRPAGGAWSSAHDLIKYVQLELAKGALSNGKSLVSEKNLLARRERQVDVGQHTTYGMGLEVNTEWGIPVVMHGGSLFGYKSQMFWLSDQGVGGVILTNSDEGTALVDASGFIRRVLEVLFDGHAEALDDLKAAAAAAKAERDEERARRHLPPDPSVVAKLAAHYKSAQLGTLDVRTQGTKTIFDFGESRSAVATRKNDDGTLSMVTIDPCIDGGEFVVTEREGKRALVIRDMQHEYVFTEVK